MSVTVSYLSVTPYLRKQDSGSYLQLLVSYSVLLDVCSETITFDDFLRFRDWGMGSGRGWVVKSRLTLVSDWGVPLSIACQLLVNCLLVVCQLLVNCLSIAPFCKTSAVKPLF